MVLDRVERMIGSVSVPALSGQLLRWRWPLLGLLLALVTYLAGASIYYQWVVPVNEYPLVSASSTNGSERWALFGARSPAEPAAPLEQNISAAKIKAKLLGIVEKDAGSLAIIDLGRRGESQVFHEGDELAARVSVYRIESERILINEQGDIRSLTLESANTDTISVRDSAPVVLPDEADDESYEQALESSREADVELPNNSGLELVQIETGETGMNLSAVNTSLLQGTPLRATDVILQIEGSPVLDLLNNAGAARSLLNRKQVAVDIWREGSVQSVTIKPNVIAPAVLSLMANQNP